MHQDEKQLRIWNWQKGLQVCLPFPLDAEPVSTCFAPDGKDVAVHCKDGQAILIDPTNGHERFRVQCAVTLDPVNSHPWMAGRGSIAFSHDGTKFITWASKVVQAWDRASGRELFALHHDRYCWALAESANGKILATSSFDRFLRLWDANGKKLRDPIEHPSQVLTVAISPDGQLVATGCGDFQTRVWEVQTGKLAYAMSTPSYLTDIKFTPDGHFVISAGAGGVQVCDAETGKSIGLMVPISFQKSGTKIGISAPNLDISSNGSWALAAGDANAYAVIHIQTLTTPSKLSPEEALLWAELLSNSRINGGSIVNLTRDEWLDRWHKYRQLHPEFRPFADENQP
jgi:WD40 repeat protein